MTCTLSPDLIDLWLDDHLDDPALTEQILEHFPELYHTFRSSKITSCEHPNPGSERWVRDRPQEPPTGQSSPESFSLGIQRVRDHQGEVLQPGQKREAASLLERLLVLGKVERKELIAALPADAMSLELGRQLLVESRKHAPSTPRLSIDLAQLAAHIAGKAFRSRLHQLLAEDLLALANAVEGNGYRLLNQYPMASVCLTEALRRADHGTGDPVAFADILSYRVSLLRDQRQLREAEACARQAIEIYRRVGETHRAGRILLQLAGVHYDQDDPRKAAELSRDALAHLDANQEPETVLFAHESLAFFVAHSGDPHSAREILAAHPTHPERPHRFQLQRQWKESHILAKLGEHSSAIAGLERVRVGFAALEDAPNTATTTLDLALLYGEAGHLTAMWDTAAEALPLLLPLGLPTEILGSLTTLREAAQAKAITLDLLRELHKEISQPTAWC